MPATAAKRARKPKRISRTTKPEDLNVHEWQLALREQYGRENAMKIRNLGQARVFSEFAVTNPETERTYRVVVRGEARGVNFCSCPDYAVNTLGTCKHIEATLHQLRRRHAAALRKGYCPPFAEVFVRYGPQRTVTFSPGSDCPPSLRKLAARYFDSDGALGPAAYTKFDRFRDQVTKSKHKVNVYDDALKLIAEVRDGQARRTQLQKRFGGQAAASAWKRLLKVPLFPYQREGALFAAKAGRALIADEMGLGKTIQAIAAAEILARTGRVERVLIVCPASLKGQWKLEIEKFSRRAALVIEGPTHQRKTLYEQHEAFFKVINYDVVHRDLDAISAWAPDLVILDEAQRIKNWQTRAARTVKQIRSPYAIVLTGTPLENRLEELHSIVEFVDRHHLGPLFAFKAEHEEFEKGSTRVVGYRNLGRINKTLSSILIRRTKKQVLNQLPPRMDKVFFVPMTEQQWVPHRENQETVARIVAKWRRYNFLTEADRLRLQIALQYMRMSCDNTYLVDHETRFGTKVDELERLLEEIFELRENKVVIFSQWLRMNELVEAMLDDRGWGSVHLHGGVPSRERQSLTRALREDPDCRVFLSTDAGGVGLNLQSASAVINMDLPWNPAVLEQRIGRVHRMGQQRPVRVVNFVSEGTIEQGMLSLLAFKQSMFAGVLDGATDKVAMGDGALKRFMKTVETATAAVPNVVPTPTDESESSPGESASARRGTADIDGQALAQLLSKGAEFLQSVGRALAEPGGSTSPDAEAALRPRITADVTTGKREVRIPIPDEQTMQQWMGQLSNVLSAFQQRK